MDFPLPLTLVLMMTEDADRYAARAAESGEVVAPPTSGMFPAAAASEGVVEEPAQHVA